MSDQTETMGAPLLNGETAVKDDKRDTATPSALIDTMSRLLLEERQIPAQVAIAATAIAAATWLRFIVDDALPEGFPFVTFFPAVLVTALFASVPAAIIVALITGAIAWVFFIPPFGTAGLSGPVAIAMAFYFAITTTEIFFISLSGQALKRIKAERDRSRWLAESRDLMFSELQHRVSNNLANVAALLRLQANATDSAEARTALTASMSRVQTVARVQRNLYLADEQQVEVNAFLTQLAADTRDTMVGEQDVTVSVQSDRFNIHRDHAVPFGLIASEMMMNAIEHSNPADGQLKIEVRGTRHQAQPHAPAMVELSVSDNGMGVSGTDTETTSTSLGMSISTGFAQSLGGQLTLENKPDMNGAVATLSFPEQATD